MKPGELVNITLRSTPGSTAAISIIDKSVELMGDLNELTTNKILQQLTETDLAPYSPFVPQPILFQPLVRMKRRIWPGNFWNKSHALQVLNVNEITWYIKEFNKTKDHCFNLIIKINKLSKDKGLAVASDLPSLQATILASSIMERAVAVGKKSLESQFSILQIAK